MSEQVRYVTNEQGERVGVLLDLEAYNRLANPLLLDEECLVFSLFLVGWAEKPVGDYTN